MIKWLIFGQLFIFPIKIVLKLSSYSLLIIILKTLVNMAHRLNINYKSKIKI